MAREGKPTGSRASACLDHAATTPMHPVALAVMTSHLVASGNPSSLHSSGRQARRAVEESRETIARSLKARPSEVVFTSGGTESDSLAVKGIYSARHEHDARRTRVLTTAVEHPAVLETVHWLEHHQAHQWSFCRSTATGSSVSRRWRRRSSETRRRSPWSA